MTLLKEKKIYISPAMHTKFTPFFFSEDYGNGENAQHLKRKYWFFMVYQNK